MSAFISQFEEIIPSSSSAPTDLSTSDTSTDEGGGSWDLNKAMEEILSTPPLSAPAAFSSFRALPSPEPAVPSSNVAQLFNSATDAPRTPFALPCTSSQSPPAALSLPSPVSLPPCSPLSRSASSQSGATFFTDQLDAAVALLKASKAKSPRGRQPKATYPAKSASRHPPLRHGGTPRIPPSQPLRAATEKRTAGAEPGTAPMEVVQVKKEQASPAVLSLSLPPSTLPRSNSSYATCTCASLAALEADVGQSLPLFRPELRDDKLLLTPPSTGTSPVAFSAPSTPVELSPDYPTSTRAKERKERLKAKRTASGYIPRPPNAWLLYRSARVKEWHERERNGAVEVPQQSELSKVIAEMWRSEPLDVREGYARLALAEAAAHAKRFPDYVFKPINRKSRVKQGNTDGSPSSKGRKRPELKKSHTVSGGESLLPPFQLPTVSSTPSFFPSVLTPTANDFFSPSYSNLLTPPSTAASEAWTTFQSAPSTWFTTTSSPSFQLDFGGCAPPASAPANLSSFDISFSLPTPPLGTNGAFEELPLCPIEVDLDVSAPSASVDVPVSPPLPTDPNLYDDLVAMLAKAPFPSSASSAASLPPSSTTLVASTSSESTLSQSDFDALLAQLAKSP
ncbi:hypothetical protein JCM8547_006317 [Rhodosporidiobolus lusitaniae]